MAYQVPKQWSHGDQPTAADMQKYSDALNALNASFGSAFYNFATPYSLYDDTQEYYFVHARQYLIYTSTGTIEDPAGVEASVTLSSSGVFNSYDLDQVGWLTYGMLYQVIGCSVCLESDTGI